MGIFKREGNQENMVKGNPAKNDNFKSANDFYDEVSEKLLKFALEHSLAVNGLKYIPELTVLGSEMILTMLKDEEYQKVFKNDIAAYYASITRLSIYGGIVYALHWYLDNSKVKDGSINNKVSAEGGLIKYAQKIIRKDVCKSYKQWDEFETSIIAKWFELMNPYWELKDAREYILNSMIAYYQLGVSIILAKYDS